MTTKQLIVGLAIIALMILVATFYVTAELRKEIRATYEKLAIIIEDPTLSHTDGDGNVIMEMDELEQQTLRQLLQTYIEEQQGVRRLLEMRVEIQPEIVPED